VAQSHPRVAVLLEDFDHDPWALNVRNGTVNLRTGKRHPHDPAAMHSKVAGAAYIPGTACPRWEAFLEWALPDPEVRRYCQKLAGYSLAGEIGENVLVFAHGIGANGKSVVFDVLRRTFGDYGVAGPPDLLVQRRGDDGHTTMIAGLRGYRFVTTVEIGEGRQLAVARMAELTGDRQVSARLMRQDNQMFENVMTLWLAANHKPKVDGLDEAVWRRIRVLPFTARVQDSEKIGTLAEELYADEADGILGWLIAGMMLYHAEGLTPPEAVRVATGEYRDASNPLREWVDAECVLEPGAVTPAGELRKAYESWADRQRHQKVPNGNSWGKGLEALGCKSERGAHGVRRWAGIRLVEGDAG
jgi:putative DNA primase/helicase